MEVEGGVHQNTEVRMGGCHPDRGTIYVIQRKGEGMGLALKTHGHAFVLVQAEVPGRGDVLHNSDIPLAQLGGTDICSV